MTVAAIRFAVIGVCVIGIAGMIVGSIADNNNGVVVTFGLLTAMAIVVLMAVSAAVRATQRELTAVDESVAVSVEQRVNSLVDAGADEAALRELVREASRLRRPI